jgi:AcrR family transcriptional regulator
MSSPEPSIKTAPELPTAERVLIAAKALFAQSGFENTTTASIARMARTSESQIVKHFGSKEGLLEEIFEDGWRHIAHSFAAIEYLPNPSAKLQALVGSVLSKLEDDDQLKQLFLLEGRRIRKEGHLVLLTKGYLDLIKTVDGLLAEMKRQGQLRPDLNVEATRSALTGMVEGLLRDRLMARRANYPAAFSSDDIRKLFLHVLQSFSVKS